MAELKQLIEIAKDNLPVIVVLLVVVGAIFYRALDNTK